MFRDWAILNFPAHTVSLGVLRMKSSSIAALLLLCSFTYVALANELLSHTVRFSLPKVNTKGTISTVDLDGLPLSTLPREAMLPFKPIRLLVPFGQKVLSVNVSAGKKALEIRDVVVAKAPSIGPISLQAKRQRKFLGLYPSANRKESVGVQPGDVYSSRGVQQWHGFRFVDLNLNPVQYDRSESQLWSYEELTIEIELEADDCALPCSPKAEQRKLLERLVENPEVLQTYDGHASVHEEPLDYLIITRDEFASVEGPNSLTEFVEFLAGRGVKAEIVTVENLLSNGSSSLSLVEQIRGCVSRYYTKRGIGFVLLVGDAHKTDTQGIPAPTLYSEFVWEGRQFRADLAADVYYTLTDGEMDFDGDGHNGEPCDGTDGQEIDLYAEVAIGRFPVDDANELKLLVARTKKAYEIADEGQRRQILFAGENLFPGVWGRQYMEELEFGASAHGFTTSGVPEEYSIDHLFDLGKSRSWGSRDLLNKINAGIYQLHHVGHSATWMTMRCYSSSLNSLKPNQPFMIYTQGCHGGRFTVDDCIIEKFLLNPNGAFACFSNSHYGLGPEDPDDDETVQCRGASQYFHRQFLHTLWQNETNRLGELNQRSKEANIPWMHHGTTRWVFWEMNLLGDPHLPLLR